MKITPQPRLNASVVSDTVKQRTVLGKMLKLKKPYIGMKKQPSVPF